jgi:replicative DNA helicase
MTRELEVPFMIRIDNNRALEIFGAEVEEDTDAERGFLSVTKWPEDIEAFSLEIWNYALEQGINEEHFTNKSHREWFIACKQADAEDEFGMFGAYKRIAGGRQAWDIENPDWNSRVLDACETSLRGKDFVDRLVRAKKFRELNKLTRHIQEELMDANGATDPKQICIMIDNKINQLMDLKERTMRSAQELTEYTALRIEEERKQGGASIVTHLPWLNGVLDGGFRAGQLVIVAARPSVGKTTLAMNFAYHAGKKGKTTAIFSLEMSADQLWKKIAAIDSGVDLSKFASGFDTEADRELLKSGLSNIAKLPIYVDDDSSQSIARVRSACKLIKRRGSLDAVVVDYVGLLTPDDKGMPREQQVAHISRTCKIIAKELECVVFLVCQLNRESEKSKTEPGMHNLRESGAIEQDADSVILLHREILGDDPEKCAVIVAKNRFGRSGHSRDKIKFDRKTQRFVEQVQPRLNGGDAKPATQSDFIEKTQNRI